MFTGGGHLQRPQQYQRRLRIMQLMGQDLRPTEITRAIQAEFGVSRRCAMKDWSTRGQWIPMMTGTQEMAKEYKHLPYDLLNTYDMLRGECFKIFEEATNDWAKLKALG